MSNNNKTARLLQSTPAAVPSERGRYDLNDSLEQDGTQQTVCPLCHKRALSVTRRGDRVLVHCFYGCEQRELWHALGAPHQPPLPYQPSKTNAAKTFALALWQKSLPAEETVVVAYLAARSLVGVIPSSLRFLPNCLHKPTMACYPAMVAAVTDWQGHIRAIHRTFLAPDGKGKAPVTLAKMTLGQVGGLSCHLAPAGEELAITEGIETGLSVQLSTHFPTWAALSAGGISNLILPPLPLASTVTIYADNDPIGIRSAQKAAYRWREEGRHVKIVLPPEGMDFNDIMMEAAQ